jgi:hypothetical protein
MTDKPTKELIDITRLPVAEESNPTDERLDALQDQIHNLHAEIQDLSHRIAPQIDPRIAGYNTPPTRTEAMVKQAFDNLGMDYESTHNPPERPTVHTLFGHIIKTYEDFEYIEYLLDDSQKDLIDTARKHDISINTLMHSFSMQNEFHRPSALCTAVRNSMTGFSGDPNYVARNQAMERWGLKRPWYRRIFGR